MTYRRLTMQQNAVGTEQFGTVQTLRLSVLLTSRQCLAYITLRKPAQYAMYKKIPLKFTDIFPKRL